LKVTASDALAELKVNRFDLLILDINIPKRTGEIASRGAGLGILRELGRDETIIPPKYGGGITQYEDVYDEFGPEF
jgi:CheY-like chemotaxis protein